MKVLKFIQNLILASANWALVNWLALVIFLTVYWMVFLSLIAFSWLFGFWYNAFHHVKDFDLASCWTGVQTSGVAFMSIMGLSGAAWAKYHTDSKNNTEQGQEPLWGIFKNKQ